VSSLLKSPTPTTRQSVGTPGSGIEVDVAPSISQSKVADVPRCRNRMSLLPSAQCPAENRPDALRGIGRELAAMGHTNKRGAPYSASWVKSMVDGPTPCVRR